MSKGRRRELLLSLSLSEILLLPLLALFSLLLWPMLRMSNLTSISQSIDALSRLLASWVGPLSKQRLYQLVDTASRIPHGQGRCLPRSLLVAGLGKSKDPRFQLVVGVRQVEGKVEGHAWVEQRGQVLGAPSEDNQRFAVLLRL